MASLVSAVIVLIGCGAGSQSDLATEAATPVSGSTESAEALPALPPGQSLGNELGISAVPNLRDVGGYTTADGATVARGVVYRSEVFHPLGAEDIESLGRVGLKTVYDLRTTAEIAEKPDQLPADAHHITLNVLADSKGAAPAELGALMHDPKKANAELGGGKIEAMFTKGYREFVSLESAKTAYRELFLSLADGANAPGVFHCTTGKDRTGWAAAALLTLLGVPQETVLEDFLRSNDYILPQYQKVVDEFVADGGDREIPLAIFGVKAEYLEASFDEMRTQYGSIEEYFADGLGIDAAGQAALRDRFIE
ncbi:MAG: tyrosine-protein phosphatase [Thermoanaerobaculales bacterium]|nr:tyrosine-protein phosphatase [Thermoanaerobaculales bacterium]